MVTSLIINNINFKKSKHSYSAERSYKPVNAIANNCIIIKFKLSIPMWINDKEMIKDDSMSIIYARNKKSKCNQYIVSLKNIDNGYPNVGKNKYLVIKREYDVLDWVKTGCDFHFLLSRDREQIFREIRSNIILQEIGDATRKWNDITDGRFYDKNEGKVIYSASRYAKAADMLNNPDNWPEPMHTQFVEVNDNTLINN